MLLYIDIKSYWPQRKASSVKLLSKNFCMDNVNFGFLECIVVKCCMVVALQTALHNSIGEQTG